MRRLPSAAAGCSASPPAAAVLLAVVVIVALDLIGTIGDINVAQVEKLSEFRATLGGGGFI